jgi:putative DNA primase/helicase
MHYINNLALTATNPISFDISSSPSLAVYSNKYKKQVQWLYRTLTKNNVAGIKYCFPDEVTKINRCLAYSFDEPFVDTYMPLYSSNGIFKLIEIIREKCVLNFSVKSDTGQTEDASTDSYLIHLDNEDLFKIEQPVVKTSDELINEVLKHSNDATQFKPTQQVSATENVKDVLDKLLLHIHAKSPREAGNIPDTENITERMQVVISVAFLLEKALANKWPFVRYQNSFYLYTGTYWQKINEDVLKEFLSKAAVRIGIHSLTARYYGFIENQFKQFRSAAFFDTPITDPTVTMINLANGTYVISPSRKYLKPFDQEDFIKYKLPFAYIPGAKSPLFSDYLNRVLPDVEKQNVLAEFLGYLFVKNTVLKLEKGLILYGSGANGKSVFFEIVLKLLGSDNVSNYTLQSLTDNNGYTRSMLSGKIVNYASEISSKMNPTLFKMMISGEPIECRQIYEKPFLLENYARFIFNTNVLPKDVEMNDGFFRRFLIIHFDQHIKDDEKNPKLAQQIIQNELPGVFEWLLEGLERVLKQRGFSHCSAIDDAVMEYRKNSDSVALFLEDSMYEPSDADFKTTKEIFDSYKSFCQDANYSACSIKTFNERLRNYNYIITRRSGGRIIGIIKSFQK